MIIKTTSFYLSLNIFILNICFSHGSEDTDSLYKKAFELIIESKTNCIFKHIVLNDSLSDFFLSSEILQLPNTILDTTNNSFYSDEKLYIKSPGVIAINEKLYNFNYIDENRFYDSTKSKFVIFFTEILDNRFIGEVYLFNYSPVIFIGRKYDFKRNVEFNKLYKHLSEFDIVSRYLFIINNGQIYNFICK